MKLEYYHNHYLHGCYLFDRKSSMVALSDKDFRKPVGGDLVKVEDGQYQECQDYIAGWNVCLSKTEDRDGFYLVCFK